VPHHPEQHVNAARLTELGLATVVDRGDASAGVLRAAATRVVEDAGMRSRVERMSVHVRAAGGAARAADAIESRLRLGVS
jgi:UDP:flavonoid glycosyltransferase YjiC (YdhE family)